jgi:hypothetical protein
LRCAETVGRRWSESSDTTDQQRTIYTTGAWPKDFTKIEITALQNKPEPTKYSDHCTSSLIVYTAKVLARILRRRTETRTEDVLGEDQFGLEDEKSKFSWDAENNNRTNFGNRRRNVCLLYRLAEGI